jgi:hypothetical protein
VLSSVDQRLLVLRNGKMIGRGRVRSRRTTSPHQVPQLLASTLAGTANGSMGVPGAEGTGTALDLFRAADLRSTGLPAEGAGVLTPA